MSNGAQPALIDDDDSSDFLGAIPPLQGEHGEILTWTIRTMTRQHQRHQRAIGGLDERLRRIEESEELRKQWRDSTDANMRTLLERIPATDGVTGWRALFTPRHFPWVINSVLTAFLAVLVWGVIFGSADVGRRINDVRGSAQHAPQ